MPTSVPFKKNVAAVLYTGLISQADSKLLKANPTIAAGDFKVSTDGGAFANLATLPTVTPAAGTAVKISLSAGELNGDDVVVACIDAAGAEWCDRFLSIKTAARNLDDLAFPATTGRSMVVDAAGLVDANMVKAGPTGAGTAQTARDLGASVLLSTGTGTGQLDFTSGVVKSNLTQLLGTAVPAPTVAGIPNVNAKTWNDLATVALPLIPTTAGRTLDVSATGEAGVDWANVGSPTTTLGLTNTTVGIVTTYTGNTPQTGDNFVRLGAPAGASVSADVAAVKAETAAIKAKTDNLPASPASTTNITAGTITTVTNLTNAPTVGDLTAAMKASVTTAATAASPTVGAYAAGQDPATLVLGATAATWNGAGTIGQKINAAGGATDPLLNAVPGAYASGTAGFNIGLIDDIKAKTDTIGAQSVTVLSPVSATGDVTIVAGDAYTNSDATAIEWTRTGWINLTGVTLVQVSVRGDGGSTTTFTGSAPTVGVGAQTIRLELTEAQSVLLTTGVYDIQITLAAKIHTLAIGRFTVLSGITP